MCGGHYDNFKELPKHFIKVGGEEIIKRTLRLLQKYGIDKNDIIITSSHPAFKQLGVKVTSDKKNTYSENGFFRDIKGYWVDGFYHLNEPTCYLFGDVYYSENCIKTIIATTTDDIVFFATAKPFVKEYIKNHTEPLGFKVVNYKKFYEAIEKSKKIWDAGKFWRHPISFDLWCVIQGFPTEYDYLKPQDASIFGKNFVPIYDYSCDVDLIEEARQLEWALRLNDARNLHKKLIAKKKKTTKGISSSDVYLYF